MHIYIFPMIISLISMVGGEGEINEPFNLRTISLSIKTNLDYLMLRPVKAGLILHMATGLKASIPLTSPFISVNPNLLHPFESNCSTRQTLWAIFAIMKLDSYLGYQIDGSYIGFSLDTSSSKNLLVAKSRNSEGCNSTVDQTPGSSSCLIQSDVDDSGTPKKIVAYENYDPRTDRWFQSARTAKRNTWSPVYALFTGGSGITYSVPVYKNSNPSSLIGVFGIDYKLDKISKLISSFKAPGVITYIMVNGTYELIATSTGETLLGQKNQLKLAHKASNFIIRESAQYLEDFSIRNQGVYSYVGRNQHKYQLYYSQWNDRSNTLNWNIVSVSMSPNPIHSDSGRANHIAKCIQADLNAATDDAINPAKLLRFFSGLSTETPLSNPHISSQRFSVESQQTLWGALQSYPNSYTVVVTYANKGLISYVKNATSDDVYFAYVSAGGHNFTAFRTKTDGTLHPKPFLLVKGEFDVTKRPYYTAGIRKPSWTGFFEGMINRGYPSASFCVPIYSNSTLVAVASVSRHLAMFTDLLRAYEDDVLLSFILDADRKLVATSTNETVWISKTKKLKAASESSNGLIREATDFITQNDIDSDNTFTIISPSTRELLLVRVKEWTDSSKSLDWVIVVIDQPYRQAPANHHAPPNNTQKDPNLSIHADLFVYCDGETQDIKNTALASVGINILILIFMVIITCKVFVDSINESKHTYPRGLLPK